MLRGSIMIMGILSLPLVGQGQNAWVSMLDQHGSDAYAVSCSEDPWGTVYVTMFKDGYETFPVTAGYVFRLDAQGQYQDDALLDIPNSVATVTDVYWMPNDSSVLVIAGMKDTLNFMDSTSSSMGCFRLDADLNMVSASTGEPRGVNVFAGGSCIDMDGTVAVGFITYVDQNSTQQFNATRFSASGAALGGIELYDYFAWGTLGSIRPTGDGRLIIPTTSSGWAPGPTFASVAYLDSTLEPVQVHPCEPVDSTTGPFEQRLSDPIELVPLAHGRLLLAARYNRDFGANPADVGSVIQKTDSAAHVIAQWSFDSPYPIDAPAILQSMDTTTDGNILFGQFENWDYGGGYPANNGYNPTNIHLFKLDTNLNVLGEYVVDGFAEEKYYFLMGIRAARDGGAFMMGSSYDLTDPNAHPKAWIRKIGPQDWVTTVQELPQVFAHLFPNPGTTHFDLMLREPVRNAMLTLVDAQGRIVQQQRMDGINLSMPVRTSAPGLYLVQLRDHIGRTLFSGRWIKE